MQAEKRDGSRGALTEPGTAPKYHPDGDDRFYGEKDEVFEWGIKPILGILLAIGAAPIFILHGVYVGLCTMAGMIWGFGDHFYYWSKVHYWGKHTPRGRRMKKEAKHG